MQLVLSGLGLFQFNGLYLVYFTTVLSNTSMVKDGLGFFIANTNLYNFLCIVCIVQPKHVIERLCVGVVASSGLSKPAMLFLLRPTNTKKLFWGSIQTG